MPYYFEYNTPSDLRSIQFLSVGFRERIREVHILRI
jgi:hypothetical protein